MPRSITTRPRSRTRHISLRGIFFGTSDFAVPALRSFARTVVCELVVTQPDRPAGRGNRLQPTPVKRAAQELGITTIEPARLRDASAEIAARAVDLFGVTSYGKIIPQSILDLAPRGALNVHPSLLPLYRGATPLQSQLRDGVTRGGVTIIVMDAGMDTGDIVSQETTPIRPTETYGELHDRLASLGADMLSRACGAMRDGTLRRQPQTGLADAWEVAQTATRPLSKDEWVIGSFTARTTARDFTNFVRSLAPVPAARIYAAGFGNVKVLAARPLDRAGPTLRHDVPVGTAVVAGGTMLVRASDGWLHVDELALPGGRPMTAAAFRNGHDVWPSEDETAWRNWSQTQATIPT